MGQKPVIKAGTVVTKDDKTELEGDVFQIFLPKVETEEQGDEKEK